MYKLLDFLNDDKNLVIMAATLLAFASFFVDPKQCQLAKEFGMGLFGLAVGRAAR